MIPDKSDARWESLVTGDISHSFKMMAAGMCVSRNQRMYKRQNNPEAMRNAIANLHEFFTKFEQIAEEDIRTIFRQ